MSVRLEIPGPPVGKGRPRIDTRGDRPRTFTPKETEVAEKRIQLEWMRIGRPELGPGPIMLKVELAVARPKRHVLADGTLSGPASRELWPIRKPDLDNAVKLCLDALNGLAFVDDSQVVSMSAWRRWARPEEAPHTLIELWATPIPRSPA